MNKYTKQKQAQREMILIWKLMLAGIAEQKCDKIMQLDTVALEVVS